MASGHLGTDPGSIANRRYCYQVNGNTAPPSEPFVDPLSLWHGFQSLPLEQQIPIALVAIGGTSGALKWLTDKGIELWKLRKEQQRLDRLEQQATAEKRADWQLDPNPTYGDLLTIGSGDGFFRLGGDVQNVGLAPARLRNIQAFLDGQELPWDTSAPRQGNVESDAYVPFWFRMPHRVEEAGSAADWNTSPMLAGRIVRLVVRYADGTGDREPFVRCFRFEQSPQYQRWNCIEVDPCPSNA